jgi:hypothetical protein
VRTSELSWAGCLLLAASRVSQPGQALSHSLLLTRPQVTCVLPRFGQCPVLTTTSQVAQEGGWSSEATEHSVSSSVGAGRQIRAAVTPPSSARATLLS